MFLIWLNIISGVLIALLFTSIVIFNRKSTKEQLSSVKSITQAAFLVAISVVINIAIKYFTNTIISASIFEVKIGNFALVLIGFFCGPALGVLAGISADFLGLLIYSTGTPVLYFTLTSILWCVLPYYLVLVTNKIYQNKWTIYVYLPLSYAFTLLLISGFDPIVLKYMYNLNKGWWALYLPRVIKYPLDVAISSVLLISTYKVFSKSLMLNEKFSKFSTEKEKKVKIISDQVIKE